MATVWAPRRAPRIGLWQNNAYSTGWSHTIPFSTLADLVESMASTPALRQRSPDAGPPTSRLTMRGPAPRPLEEWDGRVNRLGIVAHGDQQGVVQLERNLTASNVSSFSAELAQLTTFLTTDAQLIFYSCIAGSGDEGTRLLVALSLYLPGRTVIGFTVMGETEASELLSGVSAQSPGAVREAPHGEGSGRRGAEGLLGPQSVYAKWARDGRLVRNAPMQRDAQNHCANPDCPGHSSPLHHCSGWH